MKTLIATAFIAATAFAGTAHAMVSTSDIDAAVRQVAPTVDLSSATDEQRIQILSVVLGGESDSEKRAVIRAILN